MTFSFWRRRFNSLCELISYKITFSKANIRKYFISREIKYWAKKGILPVEVKSHHGIGAKLIWCLEILLYCNENNLQAFFKFSYEDSNDTDDFFGFFFISNSQTISNIKFIQIKHIGQLSFNKDYNKELDVGSANKLINEYIIPRPELTEEVDLFIKKHFDSKKILGIHYRNTDKVTEAPFVSYENVLVNINHCLEKFDYLEKIFITSDDEEFIKFMKNSELSSMLYFREDSFRSNDGIPIHDRKDVDKYEINRDAVVNMLILSKCSFIIKTSSFLSSFSLLFNPSLPYIMLNKPFDEKLWFPESELIKKSTIPPIN
ncbi:MAG: hypothetical protein ACXVDZ_13615 [Bacteroidia bacterium]